VAQSPLQSRYQAFKKRSIESRTYFVIAGVFFFVSCDFVWREEHRNVQTLVQEKSALWQERDFWKIQSYDKEAALRSRDQLLAQNYTALIGEQTTATNAQQSLTQLSSKIIDLSKPPVPKLSLHGTTDFDVADIFKKYKHTAQFVVVTNVPISVDLGFECQFPMQSVEALIIGAGPKYPGHVNKVNDRAWLIHIPSPQLTPDYALLLTVGYDEEVLGACSTVRQ